MIEKVLIYAKHDVKIRSGVNVFSLPIENSLWIKRPTVKFMREARALHRDGFITLKIVETRERSKWKEEGF